MQHIKLSATFELLYISRSDIILFIMKVSFEQNFESFTTRDFLPTQVTKKGPCVLKPVVKRRAIRKKLKRVSYTLESAEPPCGVTNGPYK